MALASAAYSDAGLLDVTAGMAVAGLGSGLVVRPLTQLALAHMPNERSGMASGVVQTARPFGVTIGVTALGLVVPGQLDAAAFHAVAGTAAGTLVAALTIRPRR